MLIDFFLFHFLTIALNLLLNEKSGSFFTFFPIEKLCYNNFASETGNIIDLFQAICAKSDKKLVLNKLNANYSV